MIELKYTHVIRIHQLTGYCLDNNDFERHKIPRNVNICATFVQLSADDLGAFYIYPEGVGTAPWHIHPDDVTVVEVL